MRCVCVGASVCAWAYPSGVSGIYPSWWRSSSSWHPPLTSGMFPESLRQVDLWKDHVGPRGSSSTIDPCQIFFFAEPNSGWVWVWVWVCGPRQPPLFAGAGSTARVQHAALPLHMFQTLFADKCGRIRTKAALEAQPWPLHQNCTPA